MGLNIDPLEYINIFRPFVHTYFTFKMNRYLDQELDKRYRVIQGENSSRRKSVVDLALTSYLDEDPSAVGMTADFKDFAKAQIKLFVFAGHDTTSAGAVFTYHLLNQHPECLEKVRAEHDRIFGSDARQVANILSSKPQLLNQLPYTVAVIKESLRLFPSVAALRRGQPDFFIEIPNGQRLPTDRCLVWGSHYGTHHNPRFWSRPGDFLPERFLVAEGEDMYPPKNGWRPFERGPRNCIGQELAMTEIKLMMALTIREFVITNAYDEFDGSRGAPKNLNVEGQRAFMKGRGAAHPADRYPCKVSFFRKFHEQDLD